MDSSSPCYLIDGSGYIYRAFFGIAQLSNSSGTPTNAVFGVTRMLLKLLDEEQPENLVVVFDAPGPTFRHEIYPEYKANRPPTPEELVPQRPLVRRAVEALNLPQVELVGFEADDLIGTLTDRAREAGQEVVIVSGDKDMMQLVGPGVVLLDPMKGKRYDADGVFEKMGVKPEQVVDLLALMGDSSDNIPGIHGVGPKTAAKLLVEHGDLESVLAAADGMKKSKLKERLIEQADSARLSRKLAAIKRDVDMALSLDDLRLSPPDEEKLDAFFVEMEFSALRRSQVAVRSIDTDHYETLLDLKQLAAWVERIRGAGRCALDLETDSLDPMQAQIVGMSFCVAEGQAAYLPVAHEGEGTPTQLDLQVVLKELSGVFGPDGVEIWGQNIKFDALILRRHGLELGRIAADSMLQSYLLDPGRRSHGLDHLAQELLGHDTIKYKDVTGKGKQQVTFAEVPLDKATAYAAEDADVTFRLCEKLGPQVEEAGLGELMQGLELPLLRVLINMEEAGFLVDARSLTELSTELGSELVRMEQRIHELAGHAFNINSPSQLRVILFEELGLPVQKKTKSGPSTDQSVLEILAFEHPLPAEILAFRQVAKLKSTYADVLPGMINPETGRIHSRFHQTVAATGRLSSSDPNLQNIPVRTELGRRIRKAFIVPPGHKLLSADYSQVELRILAHVTGDQNLRKAFQDGEDVHARTAARIFDVPVEQVSSDMRTRAKAVNFGILYGQGPFALARQLGVSHGEAKEIIDTYLERHAGVSTWIAKIHEQARQEGLVTTLFGRRRFLPNLSSRNFNVRSNAERMAQNTPIQGTAADIIKRAMVDIHQALSEQGMRSRMILQVHDELMFEVPDDELDLLENLVREKMEHGVQLEVPLVVDVHVGLSWDEVH
ncbi:MAG: DNA polymerase I [Deltaproteobacteria bacterium]|nr:DNA polymerase I [Deltaproteobacteria bacterium]